MQEKRLEAQSVELGTASQANKTLALDNENLVSQHNKACAELVAWRTRAEAAELELKSLGKYASSKEEQRSLEVARLLNSRVVGVGVGDMPMPITRSPRDGGGRAERREEESKCSPYSPPRPASPPPSYHEVTSPNVISASRVAAASNSSRVVSSQEILQQAWATQRELADRLDREIALAGNALGKSGGFGSIKGIRMEGIGQARTWR